MVGAVLAAMVLTILLPDALRAGPKWLFPLIEGVLLVALIVGDPGKINRRSRELRALSIVLVAVLVFGALWATVLLIGDLFHGGADELGDDLLEPGTIVWFRTTLRSLFSIGNWTAEGQLRAHNLPAHADLAFPQHLNPHVASPTWRPRFIDYLYLGFTNATAFSPTDVMPLVPWAKIAMAVQAFVSLAILGSWSHGP